MSSLISADHDPSDAVSRALRKVQETEATIHAWTLVDAQNARTAAERVVDGPLRGVPFGVKDLIDVAGLPTECGSSLRRGRIAQTDAWLVDRLRRAGAVPLGKTVTTEFGYFHPGPTRNPHNPAHTPGGSSSGSAAAVAAGVVPFALGSQTAGSLTRPASFCGVAGYVPPVGAWSTRGISGLSPSLDAPGVLAPGVADLAVVVKAVDGTTAGVPESIRVLVWPGTELADIDPAMLDLLNRTGQALASAGAQTDDLGGQGHTPELADTHATVMAYEAARSLAAEAKHPQALSEPLRALLERGRTTSDADYRAALGTARTARERILDLLTRVDVILGPAAIGPAPRGLAGTGNPVLSRPWQLLGLPVVTVPGHTNAQGMPLGLQLVGHPEHVGHLLGIAEHVESLIRGARRSDD
ncbi:indole acetimide hydrolase [Streptomyces viridochromogenes]|uniref:Indole acetimide hydrolase n=1 Tax=Streptomyces viridochromogenes TaxID=1938 RepID=A0A0J8C0V0_STRVR|nr:amidase [Streptomyces viridochromogenes]KMS71340.1 indole acetimide hydrolase [Streptomyces viridochromogenes]